MSAEPLLLPVGQLLSVFDADRPWPEHRPASVRIGSARHELGETEFWLWWLAHGVVEHLDRLPWTTRQVLEVAAARDRGDLTSTMAGLLDRGLLVEVGPDPAERAAFGGRFRLTPLLEGARSDDPGSPDRFGLGRNGMTLASVDPSLWLVWWWAGAATDLLTAWAGLAAVPSGRSGPDATALLNLTVDGLHRLLAYGAAHLDEGGGPGVVPALGAGGARSGGPSVSDPDNAQIFPIGHYGGAVRDDDGGIRHYAVRIGRDQYNLTSAEYSCWRRAGRRGSRDDGRAGSGRRHLLADLARHPDVTMRTIEDLLDRGLLDQADPADDGRAFADRHRLRPLFVGRGYYAGPVPRYPIGEISHTLRAPVAFDPLWHATGDRVDVWQWSGECPSVWSAATTLTAMNSARGETGTDPARYLPRLLSAARALIAPCAAYLDTATAP